jgi:hypothetical protein
LWCLIALRQTAMKERYTETRAGIGIISRRCRETFFFLSPYEKSTMERHRKRDENEKK